MARCEERKTEFIIINKPETPEDFKAIGEMLADALVPMIIERVDEIAAFCEEHKEEFEAFTAAWKAEEEAEKKAKRKAR